MKKHIDFKYMKSKRFVSLSLALSILATNMAIPYDKKSYFINKLLLNNIESNAEQTSVSHGDAIQSFGICIDHSSNFGSNSTPRYLGTTGGGSNGGDVYDNVLKDLSVVKDKGQYDALLEANVKALRDNGITDINALRLFWTAVASYSFFQGVNKENALKWYNLSQNAYVDSVTKEPKRLEAVAYSPYITNDPHMLGDVMYAKDGVEHWDLILGGKQMNNVGNLPGRPLLKLLTTPDTFFENPSGKSLFPQFNANLSSVPTTSTSTNATGSGTWTANTSEHTLNIVPGQNVTLESVKKIALNMDKDANYKQIIKQGQSSPVIVDANSSVNESSGNNGGSRVEINEGDDDGDTSDSTSEESENLNSSDSKKKYYINMTEVFAKNSGALRLNGGSGDSWTGFEFNNKPNSEIDFNGWKIKYVKDDKGDRIEFEYKGDTPTPLYAYFDIPQSSPVASLGKKYKDAMHFVAENINFYVCIASAKKDKKTRQRFFSLKNPDLIMNPSVPVYSLGDPTMLNEIENDPKVKFVIYRHAEEFTSNYNVKLQKYDYETGKPLSNAKFELFEKFDDKDKLDLEKDVLADSEINANDKQSTFTGKKLYAGKKVSKNNKYESGYINDPVVWDDFRLVKEYHTDDNGIIDVNLKKKYLYEKTFSNGHPAPQFVVVQKPQMDEDGNIINQDKIDLEIDKNKQKAKEWITYYENDIKLAKERNGVHFHWLIPEVNVNKIREISENGAEGMDDVNCGPTNVVPLDEAYEKSGCKKDVEETYREFINLKYSYTWQEKKARDGYIRHDLHPDDVPIEVITTNSSEAGAISKFSNAYSQDITINREINEEKNDKENSDNNTEVEDETNNEDRSAFRSILNFRELFRRMKHKIFPNFDFLNIKKETIKYPDYKATNSDSEEDNDENIDDEKNNIEETSFNFNNLLFNMITTYAAENDIKISFSNSKPKNTNHKVPKLENGYDDIYNKVYQNAYDMVAFFGGNTISPLNPKIYSHITNDKDSDKNMWRVYDHRTEGEIHFNKKDLYLNRNANELFNSYSVANADATLEGAVYGLFAKKDITHPDGKSGVVYKAGNLVSIATTDRNGNGSFMVNTESPGTIFDYNTGLRIKTDFSQKAPKSVFSEEGKNSYKDVTVNDGTDLSNTSFTVDDYTEDDEYEGAKTQRLYDKNEENNGNSFIGRPLIMGEYYIKELNRPEGYELSIGNKGNKITNNGQDLSSNIGTNNTGEAIEETNDDPNLKVVEPLSVSELDEVPENELMFTISSKDLKNNGGYDIILEGLPEGGQVVKRMKTSKVGTIVTESLSTTEFVDAYLDKNGKLTPKVTDRPAYKTAKSNTSDIKKNPDGTLKKLEDVQAIKELNNIELIKKVLNVSKLKTEMDKYKKDTKLNGDFDIRYTNVNEYRVKAYVEDALRKAGMTTPYAKNDTTGSIQYSTENLPNYTKGIRKGDFDTFGIVGTPGINAKKTLYGPQIKELKLKKVINGKKLSKRDIVLNILDWYKENPEYSFGGIDNIVDSNDSFIVRFYADFSIYDKKKPLVTSTDGNDAIIYYPVEYNPNSKNYKPNTVYLTYAANKSNKVFGQFANFEDNDNKVNAVLVPDAKINPDGTITELKETRYDYFKKGEIITDEKGNKIREKVGKLITTTSSTYENEITDIAINSKYENGKYIIHVNPEDEGKFVIQDFLIKLPKKEIVLTEEDIEKNTNSGYHAEDTVSSGRYEVTFKNAKMKVKRTEINKPNTENSNNNQANPENNQSSTPYIQNIELKYPGDEYLYQDGMGKPGTGTLKKQIIVEDRPISQRVRILKDIETNEDGTYNKNTYDTHKDNFREYLNTLTKTPDFLTSLNNNNIENLSNKKIPNFKFKMYLKSNLERLYRNENGDITWVDRNGNEITPKYIDKNNDGNYDEITWIDGENKEIQFPRMDKKNDKITNVEKIYTKVKHKTGTLPGDASTNIGDIANNVFAKYNNPERLLNISNATILEHSTSLNEELGNGIEANNSLFSYIGNNENTRKTFKINENKNNGFTRLLETKLKIHGYTTDEGTKYMYKEEYNYDKFFDAIHSANKDKWDNDMYVGMNDNENGDKKTSFDFNKDKKTSNYPGQKWFDTFNAKYQKNDNGDDLNRTDKNDSDNSAGGDSDTSFKPFAFIREKIFGTDNAKKKYKFKADNEFIENEINTNDKAKMNAEASDNVRQFAIKWYLEDEVAKLTKNDSNDVDIAEEEQTKYSEEIYDTALYNALEKAYLYLKPFYDNDLDTIYSVVIDSEENGGKDNDNTTIVTNKLTENNERYYNDTNYLPYGDYIVVEQEPDTFATRHYKIQSPQEVVVPTVYKEGTKQLSEEYKYDKERKIDGENSVSGKYKIRFNEEFGNTEPNNRNENDDNRNYIIRSHNANGDFEVYKFGLDVDKLTGTMNDYNYKGFTITQDEFDPLKDYYNKLVDLEKNGGNENSHYNSDDNNENIKVANGTNYYTLNDNYTFKNIDDSDAIQPIESRYKYASISENNGKANKVEYYLEKYKQYPNTLGLTYKDDVTTITGIKTSYDGKYSSTLVPYTVVGENNVYNENELKGYADVLFTNKLKKIKIRLEKLDSETGENILHDDAIFNIYAASRYQTKEEIKEDEAHFTGDDLINFKANTKEGSARLNTKDTIIYGSKEFLEGMNAENIEAVENNSMSGEIEGTYKELLSRNAKNIQPIGEIKYDAEILDDKKYDGSQYYNYKTITATKENLPENAKNIRLNDKTLVRGEVFGTKEYLNYINASNIKEIDGFTGIVKGTVEELNKLKAKEITPSLDDAFIANISGSRTYLESLGATGITELENGDFIGTLTGRREYLESLANVTNITTSNNDVYVGIVEGTRTKLNELNATNINPKNRNLYKGIVKKGSPIVYENEQVVLTNKLGNRTGKYKSFSTMQNLLIPENNKFYGELDINTANKFENIKNHIVYKDNDKVIIYGTNDLLNSYGARKITKTLEENINVPENKEFVNITNINNDTKFNANVYSNTNDLSDTTLKYKEYKNQNVGYIELPEDITSGTYVLTEIKTPSGYIKTKPIILEIYEDGIYYYYQGNINGKVKATIY